MKTWISSVCNVKVPYKSKSLLVFICFYIDFDLLVYPTSVCPAKTLHPEPGSAVCPRTNVFTYVLLFIVSSSDKP